MFTLVSRFFNIDMREAGLKVQQHFGTATLPTKNGKAFDPDAYAKGLQTEHEAVQALGISKETCEAFKAGYSKSGVLAGRLALPILAEGKISAYFGLAIKEGQSPPLLFPKGVEPPSLFVRPDFTVGEGSVMVCDDPIKVMAAYEHDMENAVALIAPIKSKALLDLHDLCGDGIELF